MNEKNTGSRAATAGQMVRRVVQYMLHYYKIPFLLVVLCILVTAIATVVGATFPQTLVDDYIEPMLANGSRDFSGLARDLVQLACVMALGVVTAFSYNRIMVNVSQGTMLHLRNDLFRKMEALPIQYFDTHAHGDIMSVYTNDVDTPVSYTHLDVYKRQALLDGAIQIVLQLLVVLLLIQIEQQSGQGRHNSRHRGHNAKEQRQLASFFHRRAPPRI